MARDVTDVYLRTIVQIRQDHLVPAITWIQFDLFCTLCNYSIRTQSFSVYSSINSLMIGSILWLSANFWLLNSKSIRIDLCRMVFELLLINIVHQQKFLVNLVNVGITNFDMWYKGEKLYNYQNGGFNTKSGLFTQVVWNSIRQLGCGVSIKNKPSIRCSMGLSLLSSRKCSDSIPTECFDPT